MSRENRTLHKLRLLFLKNTFYLSTKSSNIVSDNSGDSGFFREFCSLFLSVLFLLSYKLTIRLRLVMRVFLVLVMSVWAMNYTVC